jgi:hypothetical protein
VLSAMAEALHLNHHCAVFYYYIHGDVPLLMKSVFIGLFTRSAHPVRGSIENKAMNVHFWTSDYTPNTVSTSTRLSHPRYPPISNPE